jgi:hypothetical protein
MAEMAMGAQVAGASSGEVETSGGHIMGNNEKVASGAGCGEEATGGERSSVGCEEEAWVGAKGRGLRCRADGREPGIVGDRSWSRGIDKKPGEKGEIICLKFYILALSMYGFHI